MQARCAYIFVNGELNEPDAVRAMIQPGDFLIAADGGLHHLQQMALRPGLLIGDLDSVEPAEVEALRVNGVSVEKHPIHKDETDLELAVGAALQLGYTSLRIVGATGGRLDMTLANIFLLALPELSGVDARLEDGREEVFLIDPGGAGRAVEGRAGERVSLLPLGGPAIGIRTEGLYYPLRGETLYPERTRGVSNVMLSERAEIRLESGRLICIHTRQAAPINQQ